MTAELMARLRAGFEAAARPDRAASMKAYMRDRFLFYGIPAPEVARIAREATAGLEPPDEAQLGRVAWACWAEDEREWQYFACGYVRRHIKCASPQFIGVAERLVRTKSWWDTVDTVASHTVGSLVRTHPQLARVMDEWITSDDIWLARTAILHQLSSKTQTDAARLFRYCDMRATDNEFFIRKAIGWALREYSKVDAAAVRAFVDTHPGLSALSRREALKRL